VVRSWPLQLGTTPMWQSWPGGSSSVGRTAPDLQCGKLWWRGRRPAQWL